MKTNNGQFEVKNAIILAAGFGSRCVPLTYETPKGLLEIRGEPMIERQIRQLLEAGVTEIIIVVGYKKEHFDYLVDKYGVKLVFNPEYATKNNLSSLHCAMHYIGSTYLTMSDFWIEESIFNAFETRSWYSCVYCEGDTTEWCVTASRDDRIESITPGGRDSWAIVGPAFISDAVSPLFKEFVAEYYSRPDSSDFFWEQILIDRLDRLPVYMNRQDGNVLEIENFEELRAFDPSYSIASNNKALGIIASVFGVRESDITEIEPIKAGMTNRSFSFCVSGGRYIMRVPGEGSESLINRRQEHDVYKIVAPLGLCDELRYFDPDEGYKITGYIEGARVCDPFDFSQVRLCMAKLREFHGMGLEVGHTFDLFERIAYYKGLWLRKRSCFRDYAETEASILSLKGYIESTPHGWSLAHIDAVPDNFLFTADGEIRLIDWEYSSMQDPHIDIAMFAVYSLYESKEQVDALIDCYFAEGCQDAVRRKIYAYVAACGFLWSNWCEFKSDMGVEFGEYALRQYRFAKDYYKIWRAC